MPINSPTGAMLEKQRQQEKLFAAKWACKAMGLGLSLSGVVNASFSKGLALTMQDSVNWYAVAGGAALYGALKFATGDALYETNQIKKQGINNDVTPTEYVKFSTTLSKNVYFQKAYSTVAKMQDSLRKHLPPDTHKYEAFDANAINIVHLCAILGSSDTEFSNRMLKDPAFRDANFKHLFEKSDELLSLLQPNKDSLVKFTETVRQSMGDDAPFFLSKIDNFKAAKSDWYSLVEGVRETVTAQMQEFNFHYHLSAVVASAAVKASEGNFSQNDAEILWAELDKFSKLDGKYGPGSAVQQTVSFAGGLKNDVARLIGMGKTDMFLRLKKIAKPLGGTTLFYPHPNHEFMVNHIATNLYRSMTPWTGGRVPQSAQQLFTEALFNKLESRAFDNVVKEYREIKQAPKHLQKAHLMAIGIDAEDLESAPAPESVAKDKIHDLKQSTAQALINDKAFEPDMDRNDRRSIFGRKV